MSNRLVYSPGYDFTLWGIDKLHPFDAKKFSKAWHLLEKSVPSLLEWWLEPKQKVTDDELSLAHTTDYIQSLSESAAIAEVIEVGMARFLPGSTLNKHLIDPVKLATQGTVLATEYAVEHNAIAMNLGGGYHHAFSDHGEGFCFFADAALAIIKLRKEGLLQAQDTVGMIDLDAHRGNGFESYFAADPSVAIFDMYNFQVYPGMHKGDVDEFPFMVPLRKGMQGSEYLDALKTELPTFLTALKLPKLVFYNAGTDILRGDPLGGLDVTFEQVVERDKFVLGLLRDMNVPTVVVTSGGYTGESHKLIAECAKIVIGE